MGSKWTRCFWDTCKVYCSETNLHGWQYIPASKRRTILERLLWLSIQIVAISAAIYMFCIVSENYWSAPTITTLDNTNYHIKNIPFPAVAICDINRISLKKAIQFAKERASVYNITEEKMLAYVKSLGRLYDFNDENIDVIAEFNRLLDTNKNNIQFNYTRFINVMLNLTPDFLDNIIECVWKTQTVNCSRIFNFRRTMSGFCSTFNYEKSLDHVFIKTTHKSNIPVINTRNQDTPGSDMGLTVLVKSNVSDYYYLSEQIEGFKVYIYNSRDFPDVNSGGLVESLIPLGYEVFLQIDPVTVRAVDVLRNYSVEQRQCYFSDEGYTAFDSFHYSQSDCLSECKVKSILALCECVPFHMSISTNISYSTQLCTTADIPCLNKYKEKWHTYIFEKQDTADERELLSEMHNSVECVHCLPECSYTQYRVLNEYTQLAQAKNSLLKDYNTSEISLIHIYFDTETTFLYKTDLYYYWYDIVSNFGGMCGVFIGFSLISVAELVYIFIYTFIKTLITTK